MPFARVWYTAEHWLLSLKPTNSNCGQINFQAIVINVAIVCMLYAAALHSNKIHLRKKRASPWSRHGAIFLNLYVITFQLDAYALNGNSQRISFCITLLAVVLSIFSYEFNGIFHLIVHLLLFIFVMHLSLGKWVSTYFTSFGFLDISVLVGDRFSFSPGAVSFLSAFLQALPHSCLISVLFLSDTSPFSFRPCLIPVSFLSHFCLVSSAFLPLSQFCSFVLWSHNSVWNSIYQRLSDVLSLIIVGKLRVESNASLL